MELSRVSENDVKTNPIFSQNRCLFGEYGHHQRPQVCCSHAVYLFFTLVADETYIKRKNFFPPQFVWLTFQKLGCGCGNRDQLPCIDLNTSDVLEHAQTNLCLKKIYIGFSLVKPLCYVLLAFHGINYGKTMLNRVQRNQRSLSITNPVKSNIDMRYSKYPCLKGYTTFSKPSPIASMYIFTYT